MISSQHTIFGTDALLLNHINKRFRSFWKRGERTTGEDSGVREAGDEEGDEGGGDGAGGDDGDGHGDVVHEVAHREAVPEAAGHQDHRQRDVEPRPVGAAHAPAVQVPHAPRGIHLPQLLPVARLLGARPERAQQRATERVASRWVTRRQVDLTV